MVTEEAIFARNCIHNIDNTHIWAVDIPHYVQEDNLQKRVLMNVRALIVNEQLIVTIFLPNRVSGAQFSLLMKRSYILY